MNHGLHTWYLTGWLFHSMVNQYALPWSRGQKCLLCVQLYWGINLCRISAFFGLLTHRSYMIRCLPLLSLVVLAASLVLVPSACLSSVPGSDWGESWRLGKVWSSERLLPTRKRHRRCQHMHLFISNLSAVDKNVCFWIKNGKSVLLTSCLSVALCGADGGSGGGRSEGCSRCIQEVFRWTLLVLSTLVLVQPLVEDFDHGIFFQNLSIEGTDPDAEQKKHVRKLVTK